jgi:hypothetical protein
MQKRAVDKNGIDLWRGSRVLVFKERIARTGRRVYQEGTGSAGTPRQSRASTARSRGSQRRRWRLTGSPCAVMMAGGTRETTSFPRAGTATSAWAS